MSTDLTRIGERARKQPDLVFTSLYHHVTDLDNLRACYETLDGDKAVGVDGVTKEQYGDNLEENLQNLSDRLKRMGYRPKPRRRSYIPKPGSAKGRPLGISCFEDKIVELAVKRVSKDALTSAGWNFTLERPRLFTARTHSGKETIQTRNSIFWGTRFVPGKRKIVMEDSL